MLPAIRPIRAAAVALALILGTSLALAPTERASAAPGDVEINEVATDLAESDWIELVNTGAEPVDLGGWVLKDDDDSRTLTIATGTTLAPGAFLQITVQDVPGGFGLGNGDEVRVYLADGTTLVDSFAYAEHADTTWGACPDGSDDFILTAEPTPGAANACSVDPVGAVVINEIESSDAGGGSDWVELKNTALAPADVSGYRLHDSGDAFVELPSGTVIAGGGHLVVETGAGETPGLGGTDAVRLFAAGAATPFDEHAWAGHAAVTYGRCPDGTGAFAETASPTPGTANDCVLPGGAASLVINEVNSNAPDWIELANPGDADVDISGWWLADDGDPEQLGDGLVVPAGGYLLLAGEDADFDFGLGNGDEVHLIYADGVTEIDAMSYGAHPATSWARCPDLTGGFAESSAATPGAANECDVDPAAALVINEIESNDAGGDWVELRNNSNLPVDASRLLVDDEADGDATAIPDGTIIDGGGYLAVDTSGLGGADSARLLSADGETVIDEYSWTAHADETYGRCPDGFGAFAETESATKGAPNHCPPYPGLGEVVVNEVESSGGSPGDWIELFHGGTDPIDLTGWRVVDNDPSHTPAVIPAGTVISPGGFVVIEEALLGFGLGNDDGVTLSHPDGTAVDIRSWSAHAPTTYGLCPDGVGELMTTFSPTKGAPNDCSPIRINEVDSSGADPVDWVELFNAGTDSVDLTGMVLRDSTDATVPVPAGTLAPGAFLAVDVDVDPGVGLGGADSARLFAAGGALLDSVSWTEHAPTTLGRCPDGTGGFAVTAGATKGAANDCGTPAVEPWPGAAEVTTVDDPDAFGDDMSGLAYESLVVGERGILWAVNNGSGVLHRLTWSGTIWEPAAGDWADGATLRYPDGGGTVDAEGVAITASGAAAGVYVASERNNDASSTSRPSVLRYDVTGAADDLTATHEWNLASLLPAGIGANAGLEGITWVPDSFLVQRGFVDESTGAPYIPARYGPHAGGVFFVGVEATGGVYGVVLEDDGTATLVATIDPGLGLVAEVEFEPSTGRLWAVCDEACDGRAATLELVEDGPFAGAFRVSHVFDNPTGMDDGIANEGFALATLDLCVDGLRPVWYADDADTAGNALREAAIACPVVSGAPGQPDALGNTGAIAGGAGAIAALVLLAGGVLLLVARRARLSGDGGPTTAG